MSSFDSSSYEQILELELRRLNQKRAELLDSKRFVSWLRSIFPRYFKDYLKGIEIGIDDIERRLWEFGSKDRLDEKAVQARIEENDLQIDALLLELARWHKSKALDKKEDIDVD